MGFGGRRKCQLYFCFSNIKIPATITVDNATFMVATCLSWINASGKRNVSIFRENDADDNTDTDTYAVATVAHTGFSGCPDIGPRRRRGHCRGSANLTTAIAAGMPSGVQRRPDPVPDVVEAPGEVVPVLKWVRG